METLEWSHIDKSKWKDGPWKDEPDKKQWEDKDTGLPCLIVRGPHGALCGYVGVPEGHKYFGEGYNDVPDFECNGGLTFAGSCQKGNDPAKGICHILSEGEPDKTWWLGFDCAHCDDISPGSDFSFDHIATYKTLQFVENECKELARQIASGVADQ